MRLRLIALPATALLLVAAACVGGPGTPNAPADAPSESAPPAVTVHPPITAPAPPVDASDPGARFAGAVEVVYTQRVLGGVGCSLASVRTSFSEKKLDADDCVDGGPASQELPLSDADIADIKSLVAALRAAPNPPTACGGYDGTYHDLHLTNSGGTFTAGVEWSCSVGTAPDVIVEREAFIAIHTKLMTLAHLDPTWPPT